METNINISPRGCNITLLEVNVTSKNSIQKEVGTRSGIQKFERWPSHRTCERNSDVQTVVLAANNSTTRRDDPRRVELETADGKYVAIRIRLPAERKLNDSTYIPNG